MTMRNATEVLKKLNDRKEAFESDRLFSLGDRELDEAVVPVRGDLVLISKRPTNDEHDFLLYCVRKALECGRSVELYTMGRITAETVCRHLFTDDEWSAEIVQQSQLLWIDDSVKRDKDLIEEMGEDDPPDLVCVMSCNRVLSANYFENETEEGEDYYTCTQIFLRACKERAEKMGFAVIAGLVHPRIADSRFSHKPYLEDLHFIGKGVGDNADIILFPLEDELIIGKSPLTERSVLHETVLFGDR